MDHGSYLEQIEAQSIALRAAAELAGPDAPAPTCPPWNVHALVSHIAAVHAWVLVAVGSPPGPHPPGFPTPPAEWPSLVGWWDEQRGRLLDTLASTDPDQPCWAFRTAPQRVGLWSRRQAHETAIHRLDAEFAAAGNDLADAVPTLMFDSEFAADGIEELFEVPMQVVFRHREPSGLEGTVLLHAADAGRTWQITLRPGKPPGFGPAKGAGVDTDTSITGTADAVYRAVWGRPSTAVVTGNPALLAPITAP